MNIYLHRFIESTQVEGPGKRFVIWVQGCSIRCHGCMLPDTWPFTRKNKMRCGDLANRIVNTPDIEGVTILGGEPFDQAKALLCLVRQIKKHSDLSIMLSTGYTMAHLQKSCPEFQKIIPCIDIFIEGPYLKKQTQFSLPWIGSSNQIIHFISNRYSSDCLKEIPSQKVELRINPEGEITINGMLPAEKLWDLYESLT